MYVMRIKLGNTRKIEAFNEPKHWVVMEWEWPEVPLQKICKRPSTNKNLSAWSQISLTTVSLDSFSKNPDEVQEQRKQALPFYRPILVHILSVLRPV